MRYEGITFREIFVVILRRWRSIVCFALLLALLAGTWAALRNMPQGPAQVSPSNRATNESQIMRTKVEALKKQIEGRRAILEESQKQSELLEKTLVNQTAQMNNSIYMQLDPYKLMCREIYFRVDTGYRVVPGMLYQEADSTPKVFETYQVMFNNLEFFQQMIDDLGLFTEARYLSDIIYVGSNHDVDLIVRVCGESQEWNEKVSDYICEKVMGSQAAVADLVCAHTLEKYYTRSYTTVSPEMAAAQQERRADLSNTQNNLIQTNENIITIQDSILPLEAQLAEWEGKLSNEETSTPGSTDLEQASPFSSIKTILKYGIAAFVGGLLAGALVVLVWDTFTGHLLTVEQCTSLLSAPFFGTWYSARKRHNIFSRLSGNIDRLVDRLGGTAYAGMTPKGAQALVLSNLETLADFPQNGTLLLCGGASQAVITAIGHALKERRPSWIVICSGDLTADANTVRELAKCDAVISVESFKTSHSKNIENLCQRAVALHKPILGFVLD